MTLLGVVLLVLGLILSIKVLWTIGVILLVIGAVIWLLSLSGRGRTFY